MNKIEYARLLRKNQTDAESILWQRLRSRRFNSLKFLRQHPILVEVDNFQKCFFADFYCAEKRLIIEVDGSIHNKRMEYDSLRTELLESSGYKILRINNEDIFSNPDKVFNRIKIVISGSSPSLTGINRMPEREGAERVSKK